MASRGQASPRWLSWSGLVYYGETVGFVLAWIAGGAAIWLAGAPSEPVTPRVDQVAAVDAAEGVR